MRFALIATVAMLALAGAAHADFVAYNDCNTEYSGVANVTQYTPTGNTAGGSVGGLLVDFATGAPTPVTVTETWTNVGGLAGDGPTVEFAAGTDAYNTFNGIVRNTGKVTYYGNSAWSAQLAFTGLNPAKTYTLVTTVDRGLGGTVPTGGYPDRWTVISILDADAFTNASTSTNTTTSGGFIIGNNAVSIQAHNDVAGAVAKWTGINAGSDGDFTINFTYATAGAGVDMPVGATQNSTRGYAPTGFMLVETPEPVTMSLLTLGGLALLRRKH